MCMCMSPRVGVDDSAPFLSLPVCCLFVLRLFVNTSPEPQG